MAKKINESYVRKMVHEQLVESLANINEGFWSNLFGKGTKSQPTNTDGGGIHDKLFGTGEYEPEENNSNEQDTIEALRQLANSGNNDSNEDSDSDEYGDKISDEDYDSNGDDGQYTPINLDISDGPYTPINLDDSSNEENPNDNENEKPIGNGTGQGFDAKEGDESVDYGAYGPSDQAADFIAAQKEAEARKQAAASGNPSPDEAVSSQEDGGNDEVVSTQEDGGNDEVVSTQEDEGDDEESNEAQPQPQQTYRRSASSQPTTGWRYGNNGEIEQYDTTSYYTPEAEEEFKQNIVPAYNAINQALGSLQQSDAQSAEQLINQALQLLGQLGTINTQRVGQTAMRESKYGRKNMLNEAMPKKGKAAPVPQQGELPFEGTEPAPTAQPNNKKKARKTAVKPSAEAQQQQPAPQQQQVQQQQQQQQVQQQPAYSYYGNNGGYSIPASSYNFGSYDMGNNTFNTQPRQNSVPQGEQAAQKINQIVKDAVQNLTQSKQEIANLEAQRQKIFNDSTKKLAQAKADMKNALASLGVRDSQGYQAYGMNESKLVDRIVKDILTEMISAKKVSRKG